MNIQSLLSKKIYKTLSMIVDKNLSSERHKIYIKRSKKSDFGDYQINGIINITKKIDISFYQLAKKIVDILNKENTFEKVEISNSGFINIFLNTEWLSAQLFNTLSSKRLDISLVKPQNIIVDYSSPNIAKEMHVGHMRSTIIGDAIVRLLEFLGHNVIRVNHIGDWGTQFGMLIAYLEEKQYSNQEICITNLESFYREAKKKYDQHSDFTKRAREYVVKLQHGDKYCRHIWKKLVDITMKQNQIIYNKLNVTLSYNDIMGESLYQDMLPDIISDLKKKGLAIQDQNAIIVLLEEFKNKNNQPMGVVIQKKDGAYLYTTTDIACAKYRCDKLKADRILYYIDSRQHQHLMQAWTIARKAGYIPDSVSLEHHMFGMVLGKDGKPLKTRSGETIKLNSLLDEAVKRAHNVISNKITSITDRSEIEHLARVIGIGSVKYADLSKCRTTDYVFDWDQMLKFEGNTAPYIQYAYTRIMSIFNKTGYSYKNFLNHIEEIKEEIKLESNIERQLAICLLQYEETITNVADLGMPHILCTYLYRLSVLFSSFYEECSIIEAKSKSLFYSRLQIALLTARILEHGLNLLGIQVVDRM
ncbi:arginine--tRNA ligase [Candidatus Schneideria nysicola]|uniref:arginine--tRNA ligase n=1 Tax=Candidatus Schneideria nysicola TaxID=1081631 RepID=UPI001CAA662F|nr:arginine--tRNA ligase [Candidatus Schneideria nysicola]UAJ65963.1 arginine--tRNA ligase [Candidatus Schneideria nysicola]